MFTRNPSTLARYLFTIAVVALATLVRFFLTPLLGQGVPFILYFPTVVVSAGFGGLGSGLAATALSSLIAWYGFIPPNDPVGPALSQLGVFLLAGVLISLLAESLHKARRKVEQSEARERERREELRVTLESIGDAVIATDAQGRVTFLNKVAETLTGWQQAEAQEQPLAQVFRIVNEKTRQPVENPAAKVLERGQIVGLANHTVLLAQDGTQRPIDDSAAPIKDQRGNIIGVVLVFRDLTARRQAEAQQKEAETRFQIAADSAPVMIWMSGPDKRCDFFNEGWLKFTGRTMEQELGNGWAEGVHRDDFDRCLELYTTAFDARQSFEMEYRLKRFDGAYRWIIDQAVPRYAPDGTFAGYLGSCIDITERKQAEEALQTVQAQLQLVTETMAVAVARCSRDLRYLWVSRSYAVWLGLPPEEIANQPIAEIIGDRAFETIRPYIERVLTGQKVEYETLVDYRELGPRWVNAVYVPTYDDRNTPNGWVAVVLDITRNKELEESLREADRHKDEFLAMLAHELRNPLAPIHNAAQVLRKLGPTDPQLHWVQDMIDRQVNHLARLVDDLLDVSRITQGKVNLRKEEVALAAVIEQAVETSRPLLDERGHALTVELPPAAVTLAGDPIRLAQIIANLLNNAAKYTEEGGQIKLAAELDSDKVAIYVRDNGIGISAEMLPYVFDLFTQAERTLDRSEGGLGIGLTLVKKLTEMHGGWVEAKSAGTGHGSEFVVHLPVLSVAPRTTLPAAITHTDKPARPPLRVLVVDDNQDSAKSTSLLLRFEGHETLTASDGPSALATAQSFLPDAVLLDIGLPGMNGYEVARHLRELPGLSQVFLIATTGYSQEQDRQRATEAGFDHYLVKPIDTDVIQALLIEHQESGGAAK